MLSQSSLSSTKQLSKLGNVTKKRAVQKSKEQANNNSEHKVRGLATMSRISSRPFIPIGSYDKLATAKEAAELMNFDNPEQQWKAIGTHRGMFAIIRVK